MAKFLQIIFFFSLLISDLFPQTLAARISNARVVGNEFKWDVEINRTDDWGSGGGNDILGNCDFYFYINVNGFTAGDPIVSNIHSSLDGNGNYSFSTGRAGSGSQCYIALSYDNWGGGSNWYPPLNSWELLYTASLTIADANENSGLAWHETSTGFARGNGDPLTAVLSINGQADISLPVELTDFTAKVKNGSVQLSWSTESEIDNLGFEILRSDGNDGDYSILASYITNSNLKAYGSSSQKKIYSFEDNSITSAGTYWYQLIDVNYAGNKTSHPAISVTVSSSDLEGMGQALPSEFKLYQNYPNPFNPSTTIRFDIPSLASGGNILQIKIYNNLGKVVRTLFKCSIEPGRFQLSWDGKSDTGLKIPSGVYFARLTTSSFTQTIRMTLIK